VISSKDSLKKNKYIYMYVCLHLFFGRGTSKLLRALSKSYIKGTSVVEGVMRSAMAVPGVHYF